MVRWGTRGEIVGMMEEARKIMDEVLRVCEGVEDV